MAVRWIFALGSTPARAGPDLITCVLSYLMANMIMLSATSNLFTLTPLLYIIVSKCCEKKGVPK